ncbi:2-oxoglutarate and iron-dependent oxygenase domain-containing protein [Dactylosporangium fulvum]|uniref:Isopenicillin N synthase family oxygenase n=1 Tax=Dactylosporangium fulvum TaxID=53359 RepID=A0ABY5WAP5_9ACTN|nr:2-oxoglutarate and iron-dependent oxygenase domain-containing protein [Dactylosporangium fulvum]UWP87130.1 isopenicillin N synthase family oxygenase [Dactylosporangium fulvum]
MSSIPLVDLEPWFSGSPADRAAVAAQIDRSLQVSGFLLVTGHGVPTDLRDRTRAAARRFFALPEAQKRPYAVPVGGRGWLAPGVEANGYLEGVESPPDLKESYSVGSSVEADDPAADLDWHPANVWPTGVPELEAAAREYMDRMRALSDDLLTIFAAALDLPADHFTTHTRHPKYTLNINRYPPLDEVGPPSDGQFRIGPHTDFGTVTVLDREPGVGGLQVFTADGEWEDAPYDPAAFTVNIGDLMARWTGDRWRSTRHRVLPPQASAPDEDLVSLVFFYVSDRDARIASLAPPIGSVEYPEISASQYLYEKIRAISVG